MYIFIEALRPSNKCNIPNMEPDKKEELSRKLMMKPLNLQMMFDKFHGNRILFDLANHDREFTNNTFDKITSAFKKVYPVVYEAFEQCWKNSINMSITMEDALLSKEKNPNHKHT